MKTLGLASSFREAEFTDLSSGEKTIAEEVLNTAPIVHTAYRPRFHVDYIQDTMASITIVGLKRSDRGRYRFENRFRNRYRFDLLKPSGRTSTNLTRSPASWSSQYIVSKQTKAVFGHVRCSLYL